MPGPIFFHVQTFSRKSNPGGQSVAQVIGEGLRDPAFSGHVADPVLPRILLGDPSTFQADHDAHVADRATIVRTKKGDKLRNIRVDRHTMATIVASYPLTRDKIDEGGPSARAHHADWERRTLDHLRALHGDQLRVVMAHDDEEHPHLHAWLLADDPGADATTLHPGKLSKRVVEADRKAAGDNPRAAVKAGNEALKVSMRGWLDDYHRAVGEPLGMTRDGPRRRRLSRAQWQAEKDEAARRAGAILRAETSESVVTDAEDQADRIIAVAMSDAARIRSDAEVERSQIAKTIREAADAAAYSAAHAAAEAVMAVMENRIGPHPKKSGSLRVDPDLAPKIRPIWDAIGPVLIRVSSWWERFRPRVEALPEPDRLALMDEDDPDPDPTHR